ncbi:MAG: EAL domain-containing protein (putative c-di-GMP-specific phosphodiesterase class I) [Lentisphaeria bacterium]|jgi:EAL domain-containing protein (putative c-di-GMP-specific phosphodiesterase class I)
MNSWYLEGFFDDDGSMKQQPLKDLPQILGRDELLRCTIHAPSVSRHHARIDERDGQLWITDLNSRNGTYVNRQLISETSLVDHGDVLHLGSAEVRLIDAFHSRTGQNQSNAEQGSDETKFISQEQLSDTFPCGVRELEKMIATRAVNMVFQPIILASDMTTCGYEILGRGATPDLPVSPMALFHIAESFGLEVSLSELMRNCGVELAVSHGLRGDLLVNTHPSELLEPDRLLADISQMRGRFSSAQITLEIHEQCVTGDRDLLRSLKKKLDTLSIKLAFDDFGVGQSRLLELVEAKPDLIKFDRVLIDQIDTADESRLNLLRHLKELASKLSIQTLAECVSSEGEYRVCKTMGFEYYQGFYFAKPQAAENFKA